MSTGELTALPLFEGLAENDLRLLADLVETADCEHGSVVFEQGGRARKIYILISGAVEVRFKPEDGEILTVASLERGGVFGWSAALGRSKYTSCAVCVEDSRLMCIEGDQLRALCEAHPETGVVILERLAGVIAERLRNTHQHVIEMLRHGMRVGLTSEGQSTNGGAGAK
jgi:toluene monooxygenase system ferredoxin subunit